MPRSKELDSRLSLSSRLLYSLEVTFFPKICLQCQSLMDLDCKIFCVDCLAELELIDPKERCRYCFAYVENRETPVCTDCQKESPLLHRMGAAFDYLGPAALLIKRLKYHRQQFLAEGAAAYLAAQFVRLEWEMPDAIVPVPIAFNHWLQRGYNQSLLLAQHLGHFLGCPVIEPLKRSSGDYSQAGLSQKQRMELTGETFRLKKGSRLYDQNILLIDDVYTTGATMRQCALTLFEGCPRSIYGLTVCRTMQ